jgi:hypothetical protein
MSPLALVNYTTYDLLRKGGKVPAEPVPDAGEEDTPRGKVRCVVVLDIGTEASNLIITDGGKIIWQRPIPLGGNHFTRALTKEMKLTFAKAEHLKRNAAKSPELRKILAALYESAPTGRGECLGARSAPGWLGYLMTTLPGLKLCPGSTALNRPSMKCTPAAEMSCSIQGACSTPTP